VTPTDPTRPALSVIIPVYQGAATLERCLEALEGSRGVEWECLVVDDGSTDDSVAIARRRGARVLATDRPRSGPGQARNIGAREARAPVLCFVDADVLVGPDTLAQFAALFEAGAGLTAAFGSYDAHPAAGDLLSQYRNLLHHFVHQTGCEEASTFWAGCGAIRRDAFLDVGGFDPGYRRPSIEDIELGYRLSAAGARIRLAKHVQVTHLKRWTFWGILRTDVCDRALPWTALIRRTGHLPNDLNLTWTSRASALSVYALALLLGLGWWRPVARPVALLPLVGLLAWNRDLYAFFLRRRGAWFALRAIPMHWLYYAYSALAFGCGTLLGAASSRRSLRAAGPPRPA
jgi:GT2 family glycosyltransferase